jgi:prepilin-type processing-associated H-X9-DG protein
MRCPAENAWSGFTWREAALALAVLVVLAGLLLPAIRQAREAEARARCRANLQRLAEAAHAYHDSRESFPAGEVAYDAANSRWDDEYYSTWVVPLLPYIGEGERARKLATSTSYRERYAGGPTSLYGTPVPCLICPSDALPPDGSFEYHPPGQGSKQSVLYLPDGRYDAVCSYGANWGTRTFQHIAGDGKEKNGVFHYNSRVRLEDVHDGAGHTVLLGERSHNEPRWKYMGFDTPVQRDFVVYSRWYTGGTFTGRVPQEVINYRLPRWMEESPPQRDTPAWRDLFYKRLGCYGSEHQGGCNLAMVDGSVRFVSERLSLTTLQAISTRDGGETIIEE